MTIPRYDLRCYVPRLACNSIMMASDDGQYCKYTDYLAALVTCQESCLVAGYDQGRQHAEADHLAAMETAVPKWIACSERMPEIDVEEVLAWVDGCPYPVVAVRRVGVWTEEPWFSSCSVNSEHEMDMIIPENLVTHWMPLPQQPTP